MFNFEYLEKRGSKEKIVFFIFDLFLHEYVIFMLIERFYVHTNTFLTAFLVERDAKNDRGYNLVHIYRDYVNFMSSRLYYTLIAAVNCRSQGSLNRERCEVSKQLGCL